MLVTKELSQKIIKTTNQLDQQYHENYWFDPDPYLGLIEIIDADDLNKDQVLAVLWYNPDDQTLSLMSEESPAEIVQIEESARKIWKRG